jgi:hypothetical protein
VLALFALYLPGLTFVSADAMLCDVAHVRGLKAENPNEHDEEDEDEHQVPSRYV